MITLFWCGAWIIVLAIIGMVYEAIKLGKEYKKLYQKAARMTIEPDWFTMLWAVIDSGIRYKIKNRTRFSKEQCYRYLQMGENYWRELK